MSSPIFIDYESFYRTKKPSYTLRTQITETYCKSHEFDPYMLAVTDGSQSWVGNPRDFNWAALDGQTLVAHNQTMERTVTKEMIERGWIPKIQPKEWHCTADLSAYFCNQRSLDAACEALLGIKISKDARSNADGKHWPQDFSAEERKQMLEYAQRDVLYSKQLFDGYFHKWPEVERQISRITAEQGMRGVRINVGLLHQYIEQSHASKLAIEKIIPWLKDMGDDAEEDDGTWEAFNRKPTSTKCIAEQCRRDRIPCPPVKSEDEEGYEEWEAQYSPTRPWIKSLSAWRSVNKVYKTMLVVKERLRPDGTIPVGFLYFGSHTGRISATAKINLLNQRKAPMMFHHDRTLEMNETRVAEAMKCLAKTGKLPEWVSFTIDFRALIIPRDGKKMIVSDLAQIEPRVLAWLCGNWSLLNKIRGGQSIYEAFARDSMGWTGGDLKKEDPYRYALSKVNVLGLGYGAGYEKFITMAASVGLDLTADDPEFIEIPHPITGEIKKVSGYGQNAKKIVENFRQTNPLISSENGIWRNLDNALRRSVGEDFVVTLPSGRQLRYGKIRCETRIEPDKETKMPKRRSVYTAQIGHRRVITYGAKICENLCQAVARDVLAEQQVQLDRAGFPSLFQCYDELVFEVNPETDIKEVVRGMSHCPDWLKDCPIEAEAKEVPHYTK